MITKLRYLYRAYRYRYRVDPAELRFVRDSLRPGDFAVDIGCHKGAYTYWMRRYVGHRGAVFAFEPQPRQATYLQNMFAALRFDNVELIPKALSDAVGQSVLHIPNGPGQTHAATLELGARHRGEERQRNQGVEQHPSSCSTTPRPHYPSSACTSLTVDVTTLDAYFADKPSGPDFVKIDVEGHELAVLRGARRALESHRPTLLIECESRHRSDGDVWPVFELLKSLGYTGVFFQRGRRRALAEFDPAVHQRLDPNSDRPAGGYVNNFAFTPAA
jgi:FkbM family methyltransferase